MVFLWRKTIEKTQVNKFEDCLPNGNKKSLLVRYWLRTSDVTLDPSLHNAIQTRRNFL